MKLYAHLLLAAFALHARAATIPETFLPESPAELSKEPIENISVEHEQLDQTDAVKDITNNLRVNTIEDIPVKVVVEEVPVLKTLEEGNEVSQDVLKKIREEIKDPGIPQRQEHETQNPEHHVDILTLKEAIQDAQLLLKQGFQGVSEKINHFVTSGDHISAIKSSVESLQKGFIEKIQNINSTLANILKPESVEVQENVAEAQVKADLQKIENSLQTLKTNFNDEITKFAKGVEVMAMLKANSETTDSSSPATSGSSTQSQNPWWPDNVQSAWNNIVQNFQNFPNILNPQTPASSQSDEQGTTPPNTFLQNLQNLFPYFPAFSFNQQSTTGKPTDTGDKEPENNAESSGSGEPGKKPEGDKKPEGEKNTGPIRQILERNPIIKGISAAVQRLTQNNNNPEKPKETEKKQQAEPQKVEPVKVETEKTQQAEPEKVEPEKVEPVKVETEKTQQAEPEKVESVKVELEKQEPQKTEEEKGLLLLHGHGGHHGGPGDNIDSRGGLKEEAVKEPSPVVLKDEPVLVQEKTE